MSQLDKLKRDIQRAIDNYDLPVGFEEIIAEIFTRYDKLPRAPKMQAKRIAPIRNKPRRGAQTREEKAVVRHELFLRAQGRCEAKEHSPKCSGYASETEGQAAHIISKARGGKFILSNLLWMTAECHIGWEHNGKKPCPKADWRKA